MKIVPVHEAEGMALCHDITEIVPGKVKGRAFKKGHIVRNEDITKLLKLGKEHLYVWEVNENALHENEAATRIAKSVAGPGLTIMEPSEGKVEIRALQDGLLKINITALEDINDINEIILASLHSGQMVKANQTVASCRVVPLVVNADKIGAVERIG